MKLFLISQTVNEGYDTFSEAVVAAPDEDSAKLIHPNGNREFIEGTWQGDYGSWTPPENVEARYIGEAKEGTESGVICASFHAG